MAPYILKWDKMHVVWLLASFNIIWLIAMTQGKLTLKSARISICYDSGPPQTPDALETRFFILLKWSGIFRLFMTIVFVISFLA